MQIVFRSKCFFFLVILRRAVQIVFMICNLMCAKCYLFVFLIFSFSVCCFRNYLDWLKVVFFKCVLNDITNQFVGLVRFGE